MFSMMIFEIASVYFNVTLPIIHMMVVEYAIMFAYTIWFIVSGIRDYFGTSHKK